VPVSTGPARTVEGWLVTLALSLPKLAAWLEVLLESSEAFRLPFEGLLALSKWQSGVKTGRCG
jgi:hypothetical protein